MGQRDDTTDAISQLPAYQQEQIIRRLMMGEDELHLATLYDVPYPVIEELQIAADVRRYNQKQRRSA